MKHRMHYTFIMMNCGRLGDIVMMFWVHSVCYHLQIKITTATMRMVVVAVEDSGQISLLMLHWQSTPTVYQKKSHIHHRN